MGYTTSITNKDVGDESVEKRGIWDINIKKKRYIITG